MKPGPILLFVVLAVGGGYLLYRTNSSVSPQEAPQGEQAATTAASLGKPAVLSADEEAKVRGSGSGAAGQAAADARRVEDAVAAAQSAAQASTQSEEGQPYEVEGSLPSVRPAMQPTADERELAQRYTGASSGELLSAYHALNDYYQMHFDGRIKDKSERLSPEALDALQREMAWLKERAINGKPDSDG
ncbi:MAG: hypothetical protein ACKO32_02115 [Planctomycetia bacterium]